MPISHGASPVASALGTRSGATLRGPHQPNMASPGRLSKQDISTLLGIGHFYFALTVGDARRGDERQAHQDQQNAVDPQPQSFRAPHFLHASRRERCGALPRIKFARNGTPRIRVPLVSVR